MRDCVLRLLRSKEESNTREGGREGEREGGREGGKTHLPLRGCT